MKNSILSLAIALVAFTNVALANGNGEIKIKFPPVTEETVTKPVSISPDYNVQDIEEVIAQDNQIIESDIQSEACGNHAPIEEVIAEDNKIIENTSTFEVYPLDFKKINRQMPVVKMATPKSRLVGGL